MTSLTYNTMAMNPQTYEARNAALMKATNTSNMMDCARVLAGRKLRHTIVVNGREIVVVVKRNFKALMVK